MVAPRNVNRKVDIGSSFVDISDDTGVNHLPTHKQVRQVLADIEWLRHMGAGETTPIDIEQIMEWTVRLMTARGID